MTEESTRTLSYNPRTVLYIILAIIAAVIVSILLISWFMAAQNAIESAGVVLTKPDQGLIFQH